jgi:hypothetical protein
MMRITLFQPELQNLKERVHPYSQRAHRPSLVSPIEDIFE